MKSIYSGKFRMTQIQHSNHDGFDLVGIDSKEIHASVSGKVQYAGWENANNKLQGFGQYVCIHGSDNLYYYYGHLANIKVKTGDTVAFGAVIGIEGNTGHSTGNHCHYCVRRQYAKGNAVNLSELSGIPNTLGTYGGNSTVTELQKILNAKGGKLVVDGIAGAKTLAECRKYSIHNGDKGSLTKWVQERLNALGYNCGTADGIAGVKTMSAVYQFQKDNNLGIGYLGGTDWDKLL